MHRLNNLFKPVSTFGGQMSGITLPASAAAGSFINTQSMLFSGQVKKKESLREREDRRRELSKLMESW